MAETDRREAILARLEVILAGVDGIKHAFRNVPDVPETKRPAAIVLDADEVADETGEGRNRFANLAPITAIMTPEIYFKFGGSAENVGPTLNALRIKAIKAILTDETLIALVKDNDIRYLGFATGFASGRSIEGEAGISFQFRYMVFPSKL